MLFEFAGEYGFDDWNIGKVHCHEPIFLFFEKYFSTISPGPSLRDSSYIRKRRNNADKDYL